MVRAEGAKCVEGSFRQPKSFDQETQILSSERRTEPPKMTPTEVAPPDREASEASFCPRERSHWPSLMGPAGEHLDP